MLLKKKVPFYLDWWRFFQTFATFILCDSSYQVEKSVSNYKKEIHLGPDTEMKIIIYPYFVVGGGPKTFRMSWQNIFVYVFSHISVRNSMWRDLTQTFRISMLSICYV